MLDTSDDCRSRDASPPRLRKRVRRDTPDPPLTRQRTRQLKLCTTSPPTQQRTRQLTICTASPSTPQDVYEIKTPKGKDSKRRHRKGDDGHQEWCIEGFDVTTTTGPDGRPTSILAACKLCKRKNLRKEYKVLTAEKANEADKYRNSASWSGPKRHLLAAHSVGGLLALRDALSQPWVRSGNQLKMGTTLDTYLETWHPKTPEWNRAVTNVGKYVSVANMPYHLAQTKSFVRFMRQFIPRWPSISKQTITRSVERQAVDIKEAIKQELMAVQENTTVALTSDIWTSRATDGYLTVTVHWLDEDWVMRKRILGEFHCLSWMQGAVPASICWEWCRLLFFNHYIVS